MLTSLRRGSALIGAVTALLCLPLLGQAQVDTKAASTAAKVTPDLLSVQTSRGVVPRAIGGLQLINEYVIVDGAVAIEAVADNQDGEALLGQLQTLGLREGIAYRSMIFGYLPIDRLGDLKDVALLRYARPYYAPSTSVGRVTSQGDRAMKADIGRQLYNVTGAGSKIGVLSDSYNFLGGAAAGVASDDLPAAGVQVLEDFLQAGAIDEGRAMAEIIHDVAPGASIAFNTANRGQAGFARGIVNLAQAGCNIIVDDIIYFAEPYFQDGIVAQAVDQVVANNKATYFSSAGNRARVSYQAPWSNSGINIPETGIAHNFGGGDIYQKITIPANGTIQLALQWNEPFRSVSGGVGAQTDIDILIYRNGVFLTGGFNNNIATGDPVEITGSYRNTTGAPLDVDVVIVKFAGPDPELLKWVNFGSTTIAIEYNTRSGASFGHNSAAGAISVAAAAYFETPAFNPALTTPLVEAFSSAGGTPFYFDAAGQRLAQPVVRLKPEITAVDGGNNTFFGGDFEGDGFPNFFGTSAAAPHAAAVAALLQERSGNKLSPTDVLSAMQNTALDMDDPLTPGFDTGFDFRTGTGFLQADKALQAITPAGVGSLSITSFTCNTTNGVLSSVNFVVGYPNGSFSPALPPLFINGVTANGQLGTPYTFAFDANAGSLPIQDAATRSTYLVWNFRQACGATPVVTNAPVFNGPLTTNGLVDVPFRYTIPPTAFTDPDGQGVAIAVAGLPASLTYDATLRVISGRPTAVGTINATLTATDPSGLTATGPLTIVIGEFVAPTAPADLTVTSFTCNTSSDVSSVDFVVTYADSTISPAVPPLFINGVTANGQLGVPYTLVYDANQLVLTVQDAATRSTYFLWNFRAACGNPPVQNRPPVYNGGIPATLTGTVGVPFAYTLPATAFTDPDGQAALRYTAIGLPPGLTIGVTSRVISGTPTATAAGTRSVTLVATDASGAAARATTTITINATATAPATLTVTSFTCNTTNSVLSSVNFVLGYTNGTFTPTVPALFINGVTADGQLGTPYAFAFDANAGPLPVQDAATRSTYFTWNFRAACATAPSGSRLAAESPAPLEISVLGNPVRDVVEVEVTGAEGNALTLVLTDGQGRTLNQQRIERAGVRQPVRVNVGQQPTGILLLRAATATQSKVIRVLKAD